MFKIVENDYRKGWISQGCHYVFWGLRALKPFGGHLKGLYFVFMNTQDVLEVTQQTLMFMYLKTGRYLIKFLFKDVGYFMGVWIFLKTNQ